MQPDVHKLLERRLPHGQKAADLAYYVREVGSEEAAEYAVQVFGGHLAVALVPGLPLVVPLEEPGLHSEE
jgi:hypothetical protein